MIKKNKFKRDFGIGRLILVFWPFVLALLVFLRIKLAVRNSALVESYYSEGIYPYIAKSLSQISKLIPFSLWDSFWILTILLIISGLFLVVFKKIKLTWYFLHIAQILALLYSFFYIAWGFNYFRPEIETRLGWAKPKADERVFRSILDSIIVHTNSSFIPVSSSDYAHLDILVEESYRTNSFGLGINYPNGTRRPKRMIFSSFFAKLGINGYFGPFFNEINLNSKLLPMDYPFSLAHEKAHQFGISSEAEANLAAFIICTTSDDHCLQYSGYLFLLLYFLEDATQLKDYQDYIKKIDKRVIADLRFRYHYYEGLENKMLVKAQTSVNNIYLKANHIEKGVKNYNQVVALVISWYVNSSEN